MGLYRDEAVVVRTYKLGEADRIIVLFTRDRGKVRAVAKGVRKTSSRFGARLEPTSHIAVQLYEGRELDTITQAESLESFRGLRDDLERITRSSSMLEAVDHMSQERERNTKLYTMLVGALRTLAQHDHPLIVPAFFFKLLALEGRVLKNVRQDVERQRKVLFEYFRVVGCALARSVGIEMAAHRLDLFGDREGAAPFGSLERHVFEKMRDPVDLDPVARFDARHRGAS